VEMMNLLLLLMVLEF